MDIYIISTCHLKWLENQVIPAIVDYHKMTQDTAKRMSNLQENESLITSRDLLCHQMLIRHCTCAFYTIQ